MKNKIQKKENEKQINLVRYNPKIDKGLSLSQVGERIDNKLTNTSYIQSTKTYKSIFLKKIFTFFNAIWMIIAVALILVGAYGDLLFLLVIILNTTIAIIQEIRAKITVEKLSMATLPKVTAIRNEMEMEITAEEIVLDDILKLSSGDQIPSDCKILQGNIEVNESLLTGESVPVKKTVKANLFSGSFIVSGSCIVKVEKVGIYNYIQQIALKAKAFKAPASALFKDINRLIKYIGIALIPLGILTFIKELNANDIVLAVTQTSGALTGMIPAGMFLLITIALSLGVVKLAQKKTLVKDIYCIEMLARTNVLCLDKTGTITDGTMNVVEMINFSATKDNKIEHILSNVLAAQSANNSSSLAMIKKFGKLDDMIVKKVTEFSSSRKFSVTTFKNGKTYYLGAPSFTNCPLTEDNEKILKKKMSDGYRVLALVESSKEFDENKPATGEKLLCYIVIEDRIRDDAIDTIQWFKENQVEIKIISGDDPVTVSKIAERVGVSRYDKFVSLENMSLEDVERIADKFTVFGRVSPEQKYVIVKTLKKKGKVVAMTGDGVNDTLALKEADCSIAMADGSEVARNISKLVLLNSNFASLPAVVKEGRQVINNVQNSSSLFLMKTLFTIVLCLITLITKESYPFATKNILMLEMFVIGISSFILTLEPNSKIIHGNFLSQVMKKTLPCSLMMLGSICLILFGLNWLTFDALETITLLVLTLTFVGAINLAWLCYPYNIFRVFVPILVTSLICVGLVFFNEFFGIATIEQMKSFRPAVWITFVLILLFVISIFVCIELIKRKIKIEKRKKLIQKSLKRAVVNIKITSSIKRRRTAKSAT